MNSQHRKKPGKPGVPIEDLLFWEGEWYWIFHGLVFGMESTVSLYRDIRGRRSIWQWEPLPGPKLFAWRPPNQRPKGYEKLDEERLKLWDSKPEREKWKRVERWIKEPTIPPEPQVWEQLKTAKTSAHVVEACKSSRYWLDPNRNGRPYTSKLIDNAEKFLAAKGYRYPNSGDRPSSERKRVLHSARSMAGIMEGISGARAFDLIRLLRHRAKCTCVQCAIMEPR